MNTLNEKGLLLLSNEDVIAIKCLVDDNIDSEILLKCKQGDIQAKKIVKTYIESILSQRFNFSEEEKAEIVQNIFAESWGLGLLERYIQNDVEEIIIKGKKIFVQKYNNVVELVDELAQESEALDIINTCIDEDKLSYKEHKNCTILAKRLDGSRITVVLPPVSKTLYLSIKKFDNFVPTTENLLNSGTLNQDMVNMLKVLIAGRANIMVIGDSLSGKTTLLKWLLGLIKENITVGLLETKHQIQLDQLYADKLDQFIQFEENEGYPLQDLVSTVLRLSPDILVIDELYSYEVNDLINVMSKELSGSIGIVNSKLPTELINDLVNMILQNGKVVDIPSLKYKIADTLDIVVKLEKIDNKIICTGIYEIVSQVKNLEYEIYPLIELNKSVDNIEYLRENSISDKLRNKLLLNNINELELNTSFTAIVDLENYPSKIFTLDSVETKIKENVFENVNPDLDSDDTTSALLQASLKNVAIESENNIVNENNEEIDAKTINIKSKISKKKSVVKKENKVEKDIKKSKKSKVKKDKANVGKGKTVGRPKKESKVPSNKVDTGEKRPVGRPKKKQA